MRKITLILVILVSQVFNEVEAQIIQVKGGLNLTNMLYKDADETYSKDFNMRPGFHLGVSTEIPINEYLFFEPGIMLTTKGFRIKEAERGAEMKVKMNLYYLDIPLLLKATHDLGDGLKIYGVFGQYIGIGLDGKTIVSMEDSSNEDSNSNKVDWGSDQYEDDFKRLEFGLSIGGGFEIYELVIGLSYDLGLSNISSYQDNLSKIKNRVLKLSVGYKFE